MNKVVLLTLIGTLALTTQSCSFFSSMADSQKVLEENTPKSNPVETDTTKAQLQAEEDFADLELEQSEKESLPEIAGLIPATDPEVRVRSIIRGRNDPFSVVALNPRIKIKEEAKQPKKEVAKQPSANRDNYTSNLQNQGDSNDTNPISAPLEIIEPTIANNVVISGLYEAKGKIRLIVKAPDEETSRYVEVGQYLSNGQVLIKRIDRNRYSSPKVILEQSGIEVAKTIGEDLTNDNNLSSLPTTPSYDWGTAISLK
ncbi:MAG: hypothetical protein KME09_06635 [Pleurocapsa minor HA4230-MV1]|nr:hypothetical protein [Pleurocapsa minor HA4230-MV1]